MRQSSQFPFRGSTEEFTFFKTKNGSFVRPKSAGITKQRFNTDPRLAKVRRNASQFTQVMYAAKLINAAFRLLIANAKSGDIRRRLSSLLFRTIKTDTTSTGKREFAKADVKMLEQFQFCDKANLESKLYAKHTTTVNRATGQVEVVIPSFIPVNALNPPAAATHYRLVMGAAEIGFETQTENSKEANGDHTLINREEGAPITLRASLTPNSTAIIVVVLGVDFYEEAGSEMVLLGPSALAIIHVSKP